MNKFGIIIIASSVAFLGASCVKKIELPEGMLEEMANQETSLRVPAPGFEGTVDEMIVNEDGGNLPPAEEDGEEMEPEPVLESDDDATIEPQVLPETTSEPLSFNGPYLVGGTTPVLDFNQADYDKAVASGKLIVVTFYANWCPICARQQPEHFSAMSNLNNPDVVAFRVNYKDSDTDKNEENLARKFGIAFQDTKCIVKNGVRVVKSTEFWSAERYTSEVNSYL